MCVFSSSAQGKLSAREKAGPSKVPHRCPYCLSIHARKAYVQEHCATHHADLISLEDEGVFSAARRLHNLNSSGVRRLDSSVLELYMQETRRFFDRHQRRIIRSLIVAILAEAMTLVDENDKLAEINSKEMKNLYSEIM